MPSLTAWASFCAVVLPMWTMLSPWSKQSHGCSCQGCKATNHTGTFRNLPNPTSWTPAYTGTLRNLPEPSGTCLRNLHHFTSELSGTFRNLPPELTPFYKGTLRTFRNPPPELTQTHSGTLRNLPEPSSGTCSCDPHRRTPELIWAEDPISLRCWGKNVVKSGHLPSPNSPSPFIKNKHDPKLQDPKTSATYISRHRSIATAAPLRSNSSLPGI